MSSNRVVRHDRFPTIEFQRMSSGLEASSPVEHQTSRKTEDDRLAVEREAFQKGFDAGQHSGLEIAEKKVEAILARFSNSLEQLGNTRCQIIEQTQQDLVRLALEIARKLVGREIKMDEEIILTLVRVALEKLSGKACVTVYLNPDDHRFVKSRLESSPNCLGERDLVLKAREDLKRGDCLLESPYGNVDARISEQFSRIEQGLLAQF